MRCQIWTQSDVEYLRQKYGTMTNRVLASKMGRSVPSVFHKAQELGLAAVRKSWHLWTADETDFLTANYSKLPNDKIGARLGLSAKSVAAYANRIGLKKSQDSIVCAQAPVPAAETATVRKKYVQHNWTTKELAYLREHYEDVPSKYIAQHLGLTPSQIGAKARHIGLKKTHECKVSAISEGMPNRQNHPTTGKTSKKLAVKTWDERVEERHRKNHRRLKEIEKIFDSYEKKGCPAGVDIQALVQEHRRLVSQLSSFTVPERYRIDINV